MNTENFVELRTGCFDLGKVEIIDDDGERELAEVNPLDLQLFQGFSEVLHLSFLGVVNQDVLGAGWRIGSVEIAYERPFRTVKMPAPGVYVATRSVRFFLLPFRGYIKVGLDLQ